jgi:acyl-CoA thioesterase
MMKEQKTAESVVKKMMSRDWFSQWLGISVDEIAPGYCRLSMRVRKEMLNGFDIAHGGITYSLADSALAFASNSHGRKAVSVETGISHTVSLKEGDAISAVAEEVSLGQKIGIYNITIRKEDGTVVALFKGTVYRTSKGWDV